ncbi:pyruvoyl-dependent arginine decarboxylase [Kitasatospora sp. NPDC090308]|uniref:pyruvoyl-dependent arginine decarboxylase n=1 Tax=Kitasatospora sp. NPDC090308 TaxID=3364082 RepID=UPI0037F1E725
MTESPRGPLVPDRMYFTTGAGAHARELQAHDLMYMDAGLGRVNRVIVSSRVPPHCRLIPPDEGGAQLTDGQILFAIQALAETNTPGARIATAVGVAVPDGGGLGCVAEVHEQDAVGKDAATAEAKAVQMALTAMGLELGHHDYDGRSAHQPGRDRYDIAGTAVRTHAASIEARGPENGDWVKIVSSLVFLF